MGKWEAVETDGQWRVREIEEDGNPIVVARNVRDEETARRIAAVPELLKAMEEALTIADFWWEKVDPDVGRAVMQVRLRSAIEKAKGGE
mgnify:CR=1 FL=1